MSEEKVDKRSVEPSACQGTQDISHNTFEIYGSGIFSYNYSRTLNSNIPLNDCIYIYRCNIKTVVLSRLMP